MERCISKRLLAAFPDGRRVVSGDSKGEVKIWDMTGAGENNSNSGNDEPRELGFVGVMSTPERLYSEIARADSQFVYPHPEKPAVLAVAVCPEGKMVVSGGDDNTVRIWPVVKNLREEPRFGGDKYGHNYCGLIYIKPVFHFIIFREV